MFINNLIIGGNKMSNLTVKVVVENIQTNNSYVIANSVDYDVACIVLDNISDCFARCGLDKTFDVIMTTNKVIDEITLYKLIFDKIAEELDKKEKDCIEQHKHIESCEEIVEKAAKVAKEAAKIAEDAAKECKIKLKRDKYIKNR